MTLTKPEREACDELREMIQGDFVETLARSIPGSKLKPKRAQDEGPLELEQVEKREPKLF